jgi:hypothetical protein
MRLAAVLLLLVSTAAARADEGYDHPTPYPTIPWLVPQLVPSPEVTAGSEGAHIGLRWQVTPLLYSWGIHRGLSPWRFFVVEPLVRQSGSVELFLSPEYVARGASLGDGAILRTGVRSYFPLVERGDYLSFSVGASSYFLAGHAGAAVEGGLYTLFGILGVQLTYSPTPGLPIAWITTIRIRYF